VCNSELLLTSPLYRVKNNAMKKGTVKFFNEARGFGFIKGEDGQEIFVHATGLNEDIRENDFVSYDTENGKRGLNAINVSLA
jgi:CspA family cold shock protein